MDDTLRERNCNFFFNKAFLDFGSVFPTQIKIVLGAGPGPKGHVHGAVFEARDKELGFRLAHEQGLARHYVAHDVERLFRRITVVDSDRDFEPAERILAKVHNGLTPQGRIRRRNVQAIQRAERGIKETDSDDVALDIAAFNVLARLKGAKEQ